MAIDASQTTADLAGASFGLGSVTVRLDSVRVLELIGSVQ